MIDPQWVITMARETGHSEEIVTALLKADVFPISPRSAVDERGWTRAEDKALEEHYRTSLEPIPECEPGCVMCHKELYDRSSPDGRKR